MPSTAGSLLPLVRPCRACLSLLPLTRAETYCRRAHTAMYFLKSAALLARICCVTLARARALFCARIVSQQRALPGAVRAIFFGRWLPDPHDGPRQRWRTVRCYESACVSSCLVRDSPWLQTGGGGGGVRASASPHCVRNLLLKILFS